MTWSNFHPIWVHSEMTLLSRPFQAGSILSPWSGGPVKVRLCSRRIGIPTGVSRRPRQHTGEEGLFGCVGYIVGIEGMDDKDALGLLLQIHEWQTRPDFIYQHVWQPNMLVMWDNRSVLHRATGGYEGYTPG